MIALGVIVVTALLTGAPPARAAEPYCPEACDEDTITAKDVPADAPRFAAYPVAKAHIDHPVPPDVHGTPEARRFRTMIRFAAARGPDFAGHYTLVEIGCGAGCSTVGIVDALTGRVSFPPELASVEDSNVDPAVEGRSGDRVHHRANSRLMIIAGELNEDPRTRGIHYLVWNGRRLRSVRFIPHRRSVP